MQFRPGLGPVPLEVGLHLRGPPFVRPPPGQIHPGPQGDASSDPQEPAGQGVPPPDRPRPRCQDQERGLEGILGVVGVAQDVAADIEDHRPMPCHQRLECRLGGLAAPSEESIQELGVGEVPGHPDMGECVEPRSAVRHAPIVPPSLRPPVTSYRKSAG